ncbi:Guanine nucleotide-binding protein alpha-2 subunit [Didymosphaeria variabile]|uniref:Guanine nucleotide-binding protein alpha-2 subunit n=1 Tax=Didymosphaeria variabile TaxID=1932322 RepID=A0A9W8XWK8_9PLEO|nr:Guanine nucleotide-binding protein alpha-2 subunit [Didymosphaeria variabile]KAJ4360883.1 Guanine nucleotide-binding protein alpha-2 subunit [Didymosphaeria variabile]
MNFTRTLIDRLHDILTDTYLQILPQFLLSKSLQAKKRSLAIDRVLAKDAKLRLQQYNVLPLGDTLALNDVIEGLKSNHARITLTEKERLDYRHDVYQAVETCIKIFVKVIDENDEIRDEAERDNEHWKYLLQRYTCEEGILDERAACAIEALWGDESIKNAFKSDGDAEWKDSGSYFFDNILRISGQEYIPTEEDIIHSRKGFQGGIRELHLKWRDFTLNVLNVPRRGERWKFQHQFDAIPVVLFVVDLCRYDQVDSGLNTLEGMISLFEQVVNRAQWRDRTFVLFFSNVSGFQKKLRKVGFGEYFEDFEGGGGGGMIFGRVLEYLVGRFRKVNRSGAWVGVESGNPGDEEVLRVMGDAVRDKIRDRGNGKG